MKTAPAQAEFPRSGSHDRPHVEGKSIFSGNRKFYIRGVTYGPFRPDTDGCEYGNPTQVEQDFARIAAHGFNCLRVYTKPPPWLLDCARRHQLRVLVGLPWEQHVSFLQSRAVANRIERSVREGVRRCAGHPALLGYAVGNEIPAGIVRWHGKQRVERYIERLFAAAKEEDPGALVTYVNYPSTEYLELPFVDFYCANVYLESQRKLQAYLARLQNLAGDKPLLLGEVGLDSLRHGEQGQAEGLQWQVATAFSAGCAGGFVFAWTDDWHRGGQDITDWDFGLVRRDRSAKPALAAVVQAFKNVPFSAHLEWPRISVVVCTYRGVKTLRNCLEGLKHLDYPNFEVLVVNDSSFPEVTNIAEEYDVRLLNIPHSGLSSARNVGLAAAAGEIVAYLDDDAWPDPQWLQYLAHAFRTSDYAAVGGPNIPPHSDGGVARCVAQAPGGPVHVLLSDHEAEHIPGCNMAFRKLMLEALGGFDPQFRVAGDDVDVCWRVVEAGWRIGFHPGAMVWHHRRATVRGYWKQQVGYGRAEALLEQKWPRKYNNAGHLAWSGTIYGAARKPALSCSKGRIYHGVWGTALFQSIYERAPNHFWSMAQMPEWYLVIGALAVVFGLGFSWRPLLSTWPVLAVALFIPLTQAAMSARRATAHGVGGRLLVCFLHLLQPLARLYGRLQSGLTPWRQHRLRGAAIPGLRNLKIWSTRWRSIQDWIGSVESALLASGAAVRRGGEFDAWELEVWGGPLGAVRVRMVVEEHGRGNQLVRIRIWPRLIWLGALITGVSGCFAVGAMGDKAWTAAAFFGGTGLFLLIAALDEWSIATAALLRVIRSIKSAYEHGPATTLEPGKVGLLGTPAPDNNT